MNTYICGKCQKYIYKNEIPCQTVCNEMDLDELKDLQKLF